jgi:hypothetical protein
MVSEGKSSDKVTHKVKAPATQVSCEEVGTHTTGKWQATVQACLKDGTCSDSSKPNSHSTSSTDNPGTLASLIKSLKTFSD